MVICCFLPSPNTLPPIKHVTDRFLPNHPPNTSGASVANIHEMQRNDAQMAILATRIPIWQGVCEWRAEEEQSVKNDSLAIQLHSKYLFPFHVSIAVQIHNDRRWYSEERKINYSRCFRPAITPHYVQDSYKTCDFLRGCH